MFWVTRCVLSHTSLLFLPQQIQSKGPKMEDEIGIKIFLLFACLFLKGTKCVIPEYNFQHY